MMNPLPILRELQMKIADILDTYIVRYWVMRYVFPFYHVYLFFDYKNTNNS